MPATNTTTLMMVVVIMVVPTSVIAFSHRHPWYGSQRTPYKGCTHQP